MDNVSREGISAAKRNRLALRRIVNCTLYIVH